MATGITYENSFTTLAGWAPGSLVDQQRGYAYEASGRFVHFFGKADRSLWTVSSGLTFYEQVQGSLTDWVKSTFGAKNIEPLVHDVGTAVESVWRPGLYYDDQIFQALNTSQTERRAAEQSLYVLVERLNELLLFIEPEGAARSAYGPKSRELLILASTEVENAWTEHMRLAGVKSTKQGYSTNDYVRLRDPLHLEEYKVSLTPYSAPPIYPFNGWKASAPTRSLPWYDAYNKTKHDRRSHLSAATLERCIEAVAANVVLFCIRFGPYALYQGGTPIASLVNHLFTVEIPSADPRTFYVPMVDLPAGWGSRALGWGDSRQYVVPWVQKFLVL